MRFLSLQSLNGLPVVCIPFQFNASSVVKVLSLLPLWRGFLGCEQALLVFFSILTCTCLSQHGILCPLWWLSGDHLLLSNTNDAHHVLINLSLAIIGNWIMRYYYIFHVTGTSMWVYVAHTALYTSKIFHMVEFFREMRLKLLS